MVKKNIFLVLSVLMVMTLELVFHVFISCFFSLQLYSIDDLMIYNNTTGQNFLGFILDNCFFVFLLRFVFLDFVVRIIIKYNIRNQLLFVLLNAVSILIFSVISGSFYQVEYSFSDILDPIRGWKYHLIISSLIVSFLMIFFKKVCRSHSFRNTTK
jgi:hypothetical protein